MANYQNITPVRLGQSVVGTAYTTLYTTPVNSRTYVKQMDVANTTNATKDLYIHIVPTGGTATTANAIVWTVAVAAHTVYQWKGVQIMNYGDTIQIKADAVGLTITASGGEAV
jgi:ATP-dependent protease ClpP protease subunit